MSGRYNRSFGRGGRGRGSLQSYTQDRKTGFELNKKTYYQADIEKRKINHLVNHSLSWNQYNMNIFERRPQIERLLYTVEDYGYIKNKDLMKMGKGMKNLHFLPRFDLEVNYIYKIEKQAFAYLSQTLKSAGVRKVNLMFCNSYPLNDGKLEELRESLKSLRLLESLHLSFQSCQSITDAGFEDLMNGLKYLNTLKSLDLNFSETNISKRGLKALSKNLKVLHALKRVNLNFYNCQNITDENLRILTEGLRSLRSVQSLTLNLCNCSKVTDKGVKSISDVCKDLCLLQNIKLVFWSCAGITDKGLGYIIQGLNSLTKAQTSDNAFSNFYNSPPCPLKIANLTLEDCTKITVQGMKKFSESLRAISSLQNIQLYFKGQSQIVKGQ